MLQYDDVKIELIENYPTTSKYLLEVREGYWIRKIPCVNKIIPTRTLREHYLDNKESILSKNREYNRNNKEKIAKNHREYNEAHKEEMKTYKKQYGIDNREKIKQRTHEKVECDICQKVMIRMSLLRHKRGVHKLPLN